VVGWLGGWLGGWVVLGVSVGGEMRSAVKLRAIGFFVCARASMLA